MTVHVFYILALCISTLMAYQVGYDTGVLYASPICKITCEERK